MVTDRGASSDVETERFRVPIKWNITAVMRVRKQFLKRELLARASVYSDASVKRLNPYQCARPYPLKFCFAKFWRECRASLKATLGPDK